MIIFVSNGSDQTEVHKWMILFLFSQRVSLQHQHHDLQCKTEKGMLKQEEMFPKDPLMLWDMGLQSYPDQFCVSTSTESCSMQCRLTKIPLKQIKTFYDFLSEKLKWENTNLFL